MQIVHRVSISSSPEIRRELAALGVVVPDSGFVAFDVDESTENWSALEAWIAKRHATDFVSTTFSRTEVAQARWLELVPDWHQGYPQPDQEACGYRRATYDLADYCEDCGVGLKQKAPFQIRAEPKWGRNGVLQLNWIFDEYFTTQDVWRSVFEPRGIACRPVTNTKAVELKTVMQLLVGEEVGVVAKGIASERCERCGRVKYLPVARGPFPPLTREPSSAMVKTKEYFGSGPSAHKRVVVSQALAHDLARQKVRGVSFRPVEQAER